MADVIQLGRKPAAPFAVGAMVALNSGGAWMTVRSCDCGLVTVDWHDDGGVPYSTEYLAAMLTDKVPEDEVYQHTALEFRDA